MGSKALSRNPAPHASQLASSKRLACKQVIVLPPEISMVCPSPTDIRGFLSDMVPAMREVIAANLSTEFEDDIIYILQSFIQVGAVELEKVLS
jgi:hypothetical protein